MAAGLAGLVLSGFAIAAVMYVNHLSQHWARHKPVWWLKHDLESADARNRDNAFNELFLRIETDVLTEEEIRLLAERAVRLHADFANPIDPRWESMLHRLHRIKKMPKDIWGRYGWQCFQSHGLSLRVAATPQEGKPLKFAIAAFSTEGSRPTRTSFRFDGLFRIVAVTLDGRPISYAINDTSFNGFMVNAVDLRQLKAGTHRLQARLDVEVIDAIDRRAVAHREELTVESIFNVTDKSDQSSP